MTRAQWITRNTDRRALVLSRYGTCDHCGFVRFPVAQGPLSRGGKVDLSSRIACACDPKLSWEFHLDFEAHELNLTGQRRPVDEAA